MRTARDRLIVLLLSRAGLRRAAVVGLRRSDMHFTLDSTPLGCDVPGPHVHVVRRDNGNGAWAKRRGYTVPADFLLVQAYDQYVAEREACAAAADCDMVLVNLSGQPVGAAMSLRSINELIDRLAACAGLSRKITPHMLRHGFGSNLVDNGASLDEVQELLGHSSHESSRPYLHPDASRLRAAVDRVGTPRSLTEGSSR